MQCKGALATGPLVATRKLIEAACLHPLRSAHAGQPTLGNDRKICTYIQESETPRLTSTITSGMVSMCGIMLCLAGRKSAPKRLSAGASLLSTLQSACFTRAFRFCHAPPTAM